MSEVRENEIALRKLFVGIAQLRTLEGTLITTIMDARITTGVSSRGTYVTGVNLQYR